jgi:type II secretory pathway component HofQ
VRRARLDRLLAVYLLLGCSAPATRSPPATAPEPPRDERIDVHTDHEPLQSVVARIGALVNRTILVDPTVQEVVTADLVAVPWREAIDVIARLCRCEVEERAGGALVLVQPQIVTIQGEANARTTLQLLAAFEGRNIVLPDEVQGPVGSMDREGHPRELMRQVLAGIGDFEVIELDAETLQVVPRPR